MQYMGRVPLIFHKAPRCIVAIKNKTMIQLNMLKPESLHCTLLYVKSLIKSKLHDHSLQALWINKRKH